MKKLLIITALSLSALTAGAYNLSRSLWTWSASSICAAGTDSDIAGLEGIYDGDISTCWHSNYLAQSGTPERSNPHWVMIDRGSDTSEFTGLAYLPRQSSANTACTTCYVYLSDKDLSSTPATSISDIVASIGQPTAYAYWTGDTQEKYIDFEASYKSRYILFVNISSNSSNSAACAEMNLYYGTPSETVGEDPTESNYNAIRITPTDETQSEHRIAIQGDKLTVSMNYGYVRLGNEDITVEYAMADVARFTFEHYDFENDAAYEGTQKDIYSDRFSPTVRPQSGKVERVDEVTITVADWRDHHINPAATTPITLTHDGQTLLQISPNALPDYLVDGVYTLSNLNITTAGEYEFQLPIETFVAADGTRSNVVKRIWTLEEDAVVPTPGGDEEEDDEEEDGIEETSIPTLTISRNGDILHVGGLGNTAAVALYNVAGQCVASTNARSGEADLNIASLGRGVYFLKADGITLKIIL